MRGISEERLEQLKDESLYPGVIESIIEECTELNPWLPIENAPKDRPIKIYDTGSGQVCVSWNEFYKCFTDPHGHQYLSSTHYQELPDEPKE